MAERVRQSSTSSSRSRRYQPDSAHFPNPDVFSDEYALESYHTTDGFRPPQPTRDTISPIDEATQQTPTDGPTDTASQKTHGFITAPIRRSPGSRKSASNDRRSSFLPRSDGSRRFPPQHARTSIQSTETPSSTSFRSASRASTSTMPRTQSPYQGATGPSHPYGMYAQDIGVFRSLSATTTSTVRPRERSYSGPTGPAQPYGMYSQNAVLEDEIGPAETLHPPASVGYPGPSQAYRRCLGPDVEDADDLIGPDGYTEHLPPYTRYPDGIPPKSDGPGPASILSAERDGQGDSEETLANPFQSRDYLPQHMESSQSSTELTMVAGSETQQGDEGGTFKELVKEKSRRRICFGALPLWVIAILVVLMVAVLAGVIGAVVGRARGEEQATSTSPNPPPEPINSATVVITTTSLVDATPLPSVPPDLPALPSGTFYVRLGTPTISNSTCLQSHANAWDCTVDSDLVLDLSVPGMVSVSPRFPPTVNQVRFGPQTPQLDQPVPLQLMGDKHEPERGPAWFFQQPYTKMVVVPGKVFGNQNNRLAKRWSDISGVRSVDEQMNVRRHLYGNIAQPGATPWFCYWNNTILEGFIYVKQNASESVQSAANDSPLPPTPTGDLDSPTASPDDGYASFGTVTSAEGPESTMPSATVKRRDFGEYSKVVKIEEWRDPNNQVQPYCVHMQIMNDNTPSPIPEPTVTLTEDVPPYAPGDYQANRLREKRSLFERGDSSNSACECEWVST